MSEFKHSFSGIVEKMMASPSPIRQIMKMAERANIINMGLDPDDVISFGGGWVNHYTPELFREAYINIVSDKEKFHKSGAYSATLGDLKLRELIGRMEEELFGLKGLSPENVIIGMGSTQLTHDLLLSLADPGDVIYMLDPTYANYPGQLEFVLREARVVYHPVLDIDEWRWMPSVNEAVDTATELLQKYRPKVALIPSPDNPTSQIPPQEFIDALLEVISEWGGYLLLDFAYKTQYFGDTFPRYYSYNPQDHPNFVAIHSNSKWCRGLGRRLGWVEAAKEVIDAMERTQQCTILCPDTLHQWAMRDYLERSLEDGSLRNYVDEVREAYQSVAQITIDEIKRRLGLPHLIPQGGLYTCMNVGMDADRFVEEVLRATGVLFIPGRGFGETLKEAVRISYGPLVNDPEKIKEGFERVEDYMKRAGKI
ncbi:MAG: pyridoxal phosphate-dependent aminotransferase [Thermoplasmata archaeon]|nr:pyridoxal phosphate-dependent aminotransferase [Thermoplasmata archaeon]